MQEIYSICSIEWDRCKKKMHLKRRLSKRTEVVQILDTRTISSRFPCVLLTSSTMKKTLALQASIWVSHSAPFSTDVSSIIEKNQKRRMQRYWDPPHFHQLSTITAPQNLSLFDSETQGLFAVTGDA